MVQSASQSPDAFQLKTFRNLEFEISLIYALSRFQQEEKKEICV